MKNLLDLLSTNQQQQLLALLISGPDFVSLSSHEGFINYVNDAGRAMLGLTSMEEAKRPSKDYIMPGELERLQQQISKDLFEKGRWTGRVDYRHFKTGEPIAVHATTMLIYDPETGQAQGHATIARDLRPELAAQDAIRESELKFRDMIMQAPVAIALVEGPDVQILTANPAMLALWGKDENIIGKRFDEALPELNGQGFRELIMQVGNTGETYYGYETPARLYRNGKLEENYYNFVNARVNTTADGHHTVILVATDVTPQVNARKESEESERRFRNLILEAPMATALYRGKNLVIEVANEAMLELWGKDASVIGKPLIEALPELEGQPFIPILEDVFTTGTTYHTDQQEANLMIDGQLQSFWFNFTYKPLHDAAGNVYGILNMAVDITRQVLLQQQKDEFIGIASHELKTPVTSIKAYAQVMEASFRQKGYDKESAMLGRMGVQINKLTNLISDLLDTTKIQAGKLMFNERWFNFNQVVEEVIEDMQRTSNKHQIVHQLGEIGDVFADPDRIGQVLTNLLSNAIKYSPNSEKIIVHTDIKDDQVMVCVEDFGVGIPKDKQEKVFEQFYRVSGDKQHTFPGLGLGLYISSEIIKREGGRIWVEGAEGKGSTFCFTLPRKSK